MSARGTLYAPGAQAQRVALRLEGERLLIDGAAGGARAIPINSLALEGGGYDNTQLLFAWDAADGRSVLHVDEATRKAWLADPPPALAALLAPARKRVRKTERRFRVGVAALVVLLSLPLLLVAAYWHFADRAAEWIVSHVSLETEQALGEQVFAQTSAGLKMLDDQTIKPFVDDLGRRLGAAQPSPYKLKFHVADNPTVNAFAVPGGHIVVFTGLLRAADSAEEVAGVLAHEVQHVVQRHSLKALARDAGWRAIWAMAIGDIGFASELAHELTGLEFSRSQELAADRAGYELLQRARIDTQGMIRFFEKLSAKDVKGVALLSSHPLSAERKAALEALEVKGATAPPLPYDYAKIKTATGK